MSPDELKQTFYTAESSDDIPPYQLVQLWYSKADPNSPNQKLSFNAFGENKTIELKPYKSSLIGDHTPTWIARWDTIHGDVIFDKLPNFVSNNIVYMTDIK